MAAESSSLPAGLLGSVIDYAHGRLEYARRSCSDGDRTGVLHALHQLKGICVHVGDGDLTSRIHDVETRAVESGSIEALAAVLGAGLPVVESLLARLDPTGKAARTMLLGDAIDPVVAQARTIARRRAIRLRIDEPVGRDIELPARTVLMLMDALGHLMRNAVVHGSGGGSVHVVVSACLEAGALTCTVANTGALRPAGEAVDFDSGRGLALAAVAAELGRAGGSLEHGPTGDGYRAVVTVPVASER